MAKLAVPKEIKKDDETKKKLEVELKQMGFDIEDINNAYIKAKKKDLDALLDILSEEQEKKKA